MQNPQSLDIWRVALSSGPLPRLHKSCPWVQDWPRPRGHMFYIEIYRENLKNLLLTIQNPQSLDIWRVALSSGPLPRLHKSCPWVQDWPRPRGHMFYIEIYRENLKNLLQTKYKPQLDIWHVALSYGPLPSINHVPGFKIGPAPGVTFLHRDIQLKNLLQTKQPYQIFGCSIGPLPRLHKSCPWVQDWPRPRGHMFYIEIYRENLKNLL